MPESPRVLWQSAWPSSLASQNPRSTTSSSNPAWLQKETCKRDSPFCRFLDVGLGYPRFEPCRRIPPLWPHALFGPMPAARGSAKCLPSALLLGRQGHIVVALGAAGLRHRWSSSHSDPLTVASFHRDSKRTRRRCHGQRHPPHSKNRRGQPVAGPGGHAPRNGAGPIEELPYCSE